MLGGVYHLDLGNSKVDRFSGLENVVILEMNTFPEDGLSVFSSGRNQKIVFRSNGYSRYYFIVLLLSTLPAGYELIDELRRTSFEKITTKEDNIVFLKTGKNAMTVSEFLATVPVSS
jgi:hypothetical protein